MKIFKLIKAELFKIFAKSSIFVMSFLLISVLGLAAINFNFSDTTTQHGNQSFTQVYNDFNTSVILSQQSRINSLELELTDFQDDVFLDKHTSINNQINAIKSRHGIFLNSLLTDPPITNRETAKNALHSEISLLRTKLVSSVNSTPIEILITENNYIELLDVIDRSLALINEHDTDYNAIINDLEELDYIKRFENKLELVGSISIDSSVITDSFIILSELDSKLDTKKQEITAYYTNNSYEPSQENIVNIRVLINEYISIVDQAISIIDTSIILGIFDDYSTINARKFKSFENFNRYNLNESNTISYYLFENNKYNHNFANQLAFNSISNDQVNAFDFAVYALEIFAFIIILYSIFIGSKMFAGEESDGSIKLLAIRPFTRTKIVISKILATYFIIFTLILIGAIASMISGGILFGFESNKILGVINSDTIFLAEPLTMFLIFVFSLFIHIAFYATLAIAISTISRSNVGAVIISTFIYFASIILMFISGVESFRFMPTNNTSLFKYFGGSYLGNNDILSSLFNSQVQIGSTLISSTIILASSFTFFVLLSVYVFNKREFR